MKLTKNQRLLVIVLVVMVGGVGIFFIGDYVGLWSIAPETGTSELTASTFKLTSYPDGEDVSDFVEMDIWFPKSSAEFDTMDDVYTMSNFEREVTGNDAEDISIDLRDEEYIWAEITGNSVFANHFILLYGGMNYDYEFSVYHATSDVNFNILDSNMAAAFTSGYQTADNFTAIIDCPHYTTTNIHVGDNWDVSTTDFNTDYSQTQKEFYYDEANFRCQARYLDPTVDTADHEYIEGLERYTEYFAIRITFNDSVSTVDGNVLEVNCTVAKGEDVKALVSGTYIYLVVDDTINFKLGTYDINFEMQFGVNISISTVQSGRLTVPDDTPGTFSVYSAIGV